MVYPTENVYYVDVFLDGKIMVCAFHLAPKDRDSNRVVFGYHEQLDKMKVKNIYDQGVNGGKKFGHEDGVEVCKISPFKYSVCYKNKKVVFKFNDIKASPPQKAKLMKNEVYVGPSFDESGLAFHLIFNKKTSHLFWVLNEDIFVAERFIKYTDHILLGNRTSFAFFDDTSNNRKILIGADGRNVLNNNWYDGPFDHMPDNYVYTGEIEVKKYLEAHYSQFKNQIDKYGQFLSNADKRIPVANYYVYYDLEELEFVEKCLQEQTTKDGLYTCLTQQVYRLPKKYYGK